MGIAMMGFTWGCLAGSALPALAYLIISGKNSKEVNLFSKMQIGMILGY
jgi:hypothetical protein